MGKDKEYNKEDQIDILELFQIILKGKRSIFKYLIVFFLIGLFIAVFSEKEYTAKTVLIPQVSGENKLGNLGGLVAMAGINIGNSRVEGISPLLYPKIVSSIPFKRALVKTSLKASSIEENISYEDYYDKHHNPGVLSIIKKYTVGLPNVILKLFQNKNSEDVVSLVTSDSIYNVSKKEKINFERIQKQLSVKFNDKEGVVDISFSMPEALAAAQMTKSAQDLLQDAITKFKTQKIKDELDFVQNRYDEVKKDFIRKQSVLASFKDKNQGLVRSRSQARLERLQSEYSLSFGIYSELAKQLETHKIKLKKNTPVFTIIDPVSVPVAKSKPRRAMIIIISVFLGLVIGVVLIFIKEFKSRLFSGKDGSAEML